MSYLKNKDLYIGISNDRPYPMIITIGNKADVDKRLKTIFTYYKNTSISKITDIFNGNNLEDDIYTLTNYLTTSTDNIDVSKDSRGYIIHVDVEGDWKHDHLWFKNLMNEIFDATQISETLLEDSESDYYSAEHTYRIKE